MRIFKSLLFLLLPLSCFSQTIKPGEQTTISCASCPPAIVVHDTITKTNTIIVRDTVKIVNTLVIHDTVCPGTVPPVIVVPPTTPGYTVTYTNGYDKKSDFSDDQLGNGSLSTTIFKSGTGSFKSVVSAGDVAISSGFRSEQQYTGAAQNPLEGRTEYDVRYESFEKPGWGGSSIQWHPYGGGSAFLFLETAEGNFSVYQYIKGYGASLGKIILGQWYHIAWEIKWSTGNDGYARLIIDGKLIWSYTGATWDAKLSTAPPYVKLGVNYFSTVPLTQGSQHGSVIYYDNFTVSKKN